MRDDTPEIAGYCVQGTVNHVSGDIRNDSVDPRHVREGKGVREGWTNVAGGQMGGDVEVDMVDWSLRIWIVGKQKPRLDDVPTYMFSPP